MRVKEALRPVSLFWRIFTLNALVLCTATALLLSALVTVSAPVLLTEAIILLAGLAVMLVANAILLRFGLAPLERLAKLMREVDLLKPGQRLPVPAQSGVAELIRTFNAMLDRLEGERATASSRILAAQEAERRRIAVELHDEVGQSLTAVLLGLKRAVDQAPEPLRAEIREAREITRHSLDEVRRLARRLRPSVLEDLGLAAALTSLTTDFAAHTGLEVTRHLEPGLPPLSRETELVIYRIAQESMTNIARHAEATHAELVLYRTPEAVVLDIVDDGQGIGPVHEGAGIRGMRERALLIGATLDIRPGAASGTRVRLTVPTSEQGAQP